MMERFEEEQDERGFVDVYKVASILKSVGKNLGSPEQLELYRGSFNKTIFTQLITRSDQAFTKDGWI